MAYRKKGAKSASRRSHRRRYTRRRRYRRKYPRRSGRRFPKGTEVKSKSKRWQATIMPQAGTVNNTIEYTPGAVFIVGSDGSGNYEMDFSLGVQNGQRIGSKIEPIKLRISGSATLMSGGASNATSAPNFWQIRCLVYQVRGANTAVPPSNKAYHQMALESISDNGLLDASQLNKVLMTYSYYLANPQTQTTSYAYSSDDWIQNNILGKVPLRRGIGGLCRVLYKKTFWINTQKNPVKQFRFICKCPKRFVYNEMDFKGDDSTYSTCPNNAVYILWMFQPGSFNVGEVPRLNLTYTVDLFYTDK